MGSQTVEIANIPCIFSLIIDGSRAREALSRSDCRHPHSSLQGFGHSGESIEIRACARDLRPCADPESVSFERIGQICQFLLGAIYLGPRIIAIHSPDQICRAHRNFELLETSAVEALNFNERALVCEGDHRMKTDRPSEPADYRASRLEPLGSQPELAPLSILDRPFD